MSCDNCLQTGKGRDTRRDTIKNEAQTYADQNKVTVALYKTPEGDFAFIDASLAPQLGLPVLEYVSKHT